jgi:hypothetical protein
MLYRDKCNIENRRREVECMTRTRRPLMVPLQVFCTIQGQMLAMLMATQLSLTYWGKAALTAGFLFNLTISSALPKHVTPFQILKNAKPDVSHLKVWGVHCFTHVPIKLQTKLGAKSCECLFMGYPPGGHGYRVRSLTTNHFFDSGNVIFDENISYHVLHEVSSSPINYSPLPFPTAAEDITPVTNPSSDLSHNPVCIWSASVM